MAFSPQYKNRKKLKNGYKKYFFLFLFSAGIISLLFLVSSSTYAATGILKQINFQGKVVNTDGTNVTNGSYTFLFCLYTTGSPATACTSGADNDAVWRDSKSVTVTDGIFQTNLGDTTTLPGSVDFNTDNIYLGINFNADGQMSPLVRFTAAPYAMNADKVHGLSVTDTTGTLTIPNSKTISFGDAFTTTGAFSLTLTTTASTTATLPSGTITLADLATGQTFTNKTIGSTGLVFSGATTDITTTAGEDLTLDSGTTGAINIGTDTSGETINLGTGVAVKTITIGNASDDTFALNSSGLNVTSGGALTGVVSLDTIATSATALTFAGTGTVASTTTGLTLDSGNGTVAIATGDALSTAIAGNPGTPASGMLWYDSTAQKYKINENGSTKILCNTTDAGCGTGGSSDLQTTYGNDADGSNATISLTADDDGLIFTNPTSGGNDLSAFVLQVSQQNTTAAIAILDLVQSSNAANGVNLTANAIDAETGLAITANGLTSGSALTVSSNATAFTGSLAGVTLSGSNVANTGKVFAVSNTGSLNTNVTFFVNHEATGTNNLAVRVDDVSGDTTPFVIDGTGKVGVGTTAPARAMDIVEAASAPQLRLSKDLTNYSEMTVDSVGDLEMHATGNDIRALTDNVWVCDGGACPALTLTGQGNIFVENVLKFGNGVYMRNDTSTELGVYDANDQAMLIFDQL